MRIVSLNAWGGAKFDELVAWLPMIDADVVCLQEVTRTPGLRGWTRFDDDARSLPQRADLMADVAEVLPGHDAWFTVSDTGPVSDSEGNTFRQHFGLGVFARASLARVAARSEYVHGVYVDHGAAWPHSGRPRAAQVARYFDPHEDRFVTIGQMHGLRDQGGKADTPERQAQAKRLADLVAHVRKPGDVTVVGGDFNVLPDSATFTVLADVGLTDLVGDADTRTQLYRKPSRHASYMLVSDPAVAEQFQILDEPVVSDHRPLVLQL